MSIASAHYAEYAESIRKEWAEKLDEALWSDDSVALRAIIREIKDFRFTE